MNGKCDKCKAKTRYSFQRFCDKCEEYDAKSISRIVSDNSGTIIFILVAWIMIGGITIVHDIINYDIAHPSQSFSNDSDQTLSLGADHIFDFMCNGISLIDVVHFMVILPAWIVGKVIYVIFGFGLVGWNLIVVPIYNTIFTTTFYAGKCPFFCGG